MKCSYHPAVDSLDMCRSCNKPLCKECAHMLNGKAYCQECLIRGAEWSAKLKDLHLPSESPKRAALCALIPGLGAVYNNEYMKAITFFAVWAALTVMGSRVNGIFGFGAFVFIVFTMFDAYRSAEAKLRNQLKSDTLSQEPPAQDKTYIGWGIFLILLGIIFLLQNMIPFYFLDRLWPLVFVFLGAYLVYRALTKKEIQSRDSAASSANSKEDI
jgi:4-hydroxybenzoate polyprenyltransferase